MTPAKPQEKPTIDLQAQATALQTQATRPETPVWVGASAGSGKTRVLVNRLLRLMLPTPQREASAPGCILCITFTKAGANEVVDRVTGTLRGWTTASEETLRGDLTKLLETLPSDDQMDKARALFAEVLETPGGMKIMTIHAFCQSVLARFPMEANLTPGFEVLQEADAKAMMRGARRALVTRLQENHDDDKKLKAAFDYLGAIKNADDIEDLMESLSAERARLRNLQHQNGDIDGICAAVEKTLGLPANIDAASVIADFLARLPVDGLRDLMPRMAACTTKGNQSAAQIFACILETKSPSYFDDYKAVFLTKEPAPRKLVGVIKDDADAMALFTAESDRLLKLDTTLRAIDTATATKSLLRFAFAGLDAYEAEKKRHNRLDFEDLIVRTKRLLEGDGVNWVHYKLDGGIDHILVDEAQDTNPDQWDIITALYDEFYSGLSRREKMDRTTFVVGDEKQSIFSFQRADPRVFAQMHTRLNDKTMAAQLPLADIPMKISFRSAPSVLNVVDAVFEPPAMRVGVMQDTREAMQHFARFSGKAGHVELWPLISREKQADREAWAITRAENPQKSPVAQMAEKIATHIHDLLNNPAQKLESQGRRIRPGDIMILLGKRKPLAEPVLKALREKNIPVSGMDRMVLSHQISVRDCLAAIGFVLLPDDDLTLASLLKSPFIGWDEDALYALAQNRGARSLWSALQDQQGQEQKNATTAWLEALFEHTSSVSGFLHHILTRPCPADSRSGLRAVLKRLGEDARDPLREVLARAEAHDRDESAGLQGFWQDMTLDDSELKRDLHEGDDVVRVMTVHGSKGLEAPIVYLPDTIRTVNARSLRNAILWPDRKDTSGVPLWVRASDFAADEYRARLEDKKTRGDEEQRRLLYVALTRAGERLYIGGVEKSESSRTDKNNSWYFPIEAAMKQMGREENGTYIVENRQTDDTQDTSKQSKTARETITPPDWMFTDAPSPESPPRPLMPSRPTEEDPAVMSPLFGDISHRFKRGRIIHTLFQFLPDLPVAERRARAAEWLALPVHALKPSAREEILTAVFDVLENPDFANLFTPQARAEAPLTGHLKTSSGEHTIVSGQIDRLLVDESGVLVLDFKTNRPAPRDMADVAPNYLRQMRTYRDILQQIWPGKPVRCALLWTDGPALMDVTEAL